MKRLNRSTLIAVLLAVVVVAALAFWLLRKPDGKSVPPTGQVSAAASWPDSP